jgi:hypothetical protein
MASDQAAFLRRHQPSTWPRLAGMHVHMGTLVRIDISAPMHDAWYSHMFSHPLAPAATDVDLLDRVEFFSSNDSVNGWIVGYDERKECYNVFLFCRMQDDNICHFPVPVQHLDIASVLPFAMSLGDLLYVYRSYHRQSLMPSVTHDEREGYMITAVHSKLISFGGVDLEECTQEQMVQVCRYRDLLRSCGESAWMKHVFQPHETMLPSFMHGFMQKLERELHLQTAFNRS